MLLKILTYQTLPEQQRLFNVLLKLQKNFKLRRTAQFEPHCLFYIASKQSNEKKISIRLCFLFNFFTADHGSAFRIVDKSRIEIE